MLGLQSLMENFPIVPNCQLDADVIENNASENAEVEINN